MAKNNLRSFRYSDEVAAVLEAQEGSSINDKFESLVLYCSLDLERKKQQHDMYDRLIAEARDKLQAFNSMVESMERIQVQLRLLTAQAGTLASLETVPQIAESLQEKCVTSVPVAPEPVQAPYEEIDHECADCRFYDLNESTCQASNGPFRGEVTFYGCYVWSNAT